MATATSEGAPAGHHRLAERLRAAVLGPRGGGTTRRRASDVFRLGFAVVVVAVSIPVMRANSAAELSIVRAVHPPPPAISWLVTVVFWLGSAGVSVLLVVVGLLVPRLTAVRRAAVAALATWGVCILLAVLLGPAAGRPPVSELAGVDASYPVTAIAVAIAVAATALPYLSRPVHRTVWFLVKAALVGPTEPCEKNTSLDISRSSRIIDSIADMISETMIPRLAFVALRTAPTPYRLLKLADVAA